MKLARWFTGKVSGLQSLALSLFNQWVKATLISQPGKVTYRAPLPKSFFSRLHLSPFPFFFHRGVGGGPWPRRVMSCPVAESTAVRWIWKQKQVLGLLCATRINKTPSQSLVSQPRALQQHSTTDTLLLKDCYLHLKEKARSEMKLFSFMLIHHVAQNMWLFLFVSFDLLIFFFQSNIKREV